MVIGQLVLYIKNGNWEYAMVTNTFDDCYMVLTQKSNTKPLILLNKTEDKVIEENKSHDFTVLEVQINGNPTIVPKNIFGKRDLTKFIEKNNY
ncbi:hypothetical protein [Clostridium tagluense]|uniref:Uncharacterized protein n=1 Tax=Clostridium tagluense TaxID=360422 RepID=A0A401UTR1_9CLOT|nr:hypothetical protein [Clostridium tagluense]GCD12896.1 hypothetical protein Ctaglu_45190 [Clostridium tagluense]